MSSRSTRAFALVVAGFSLFAAACADGAVEGPDKPMKSAGMLPESRMPSGVWGHSPPPTAALPRDKGPNGLERGWYKRARVGEKAPTAGDRGSLLALAQQSSSELIRTQPSPARLRSALAAP